MYWAVYKQFFKLSNIASISISLGLVGRELLYALVGYDIITFQQFYNMGFVLKKIYCNGATMNAFGVSKWEMSKTSILDSI